ncbi:hypothetical protein BZG36_03885, partial [Bifiguratus adelaidae]
MLSKGFAVIAVHALLAFVPLAVADHWVQGNEKAIHCYRSNATDNSGTEIVNGVTFEFSNPVPTGLIGKDPFHVNLTLSLTADFYTQNAGIVVPDPSSTNFTQLCLRGLTPTGQPACSSNGDINAENCCVYHVNIHACQQSVQGACGPWIQNQSTPAGQQLVTLGPSQYGTPPLTYTFSMGLDPGNYYVIGHFKMLNFQCAVGAIRTVAAANATLPSGGATSGGSAFPLWAIAPIVGGVAALAGGFGFLYYRRRKRSAGGGIQLEANTDEVITPGQEKKFNVGDMAMSPPQYHPNMELQAISGSPSSANQFRPSLQTMPMGPMQPTYYLPALADQNGTLVYPIQQAQYLYTPSAMSETDGSHLFSSSPTQLSSTARVYPQTLTAGFPGSTNSNPNSPQMGTTEEAGTFNTVPMNHQLPNGPVRPFPQNLDLYPSLFRGMSNSGDATTLGHRQQYVVGIFAMRQEETEQVQWDLYPLAARNIENLGTERQRQA